MATERIIIEVSERGSRTVQRSLGDIGDSAKRAEGGVQLLRRSLGLIGGAFAVQHLVQVADTYTNIQNRLKLVTTSTVNLTRVTNELFAISNRTRSSYEGTANMYARVALSAKDLGVSQRQLLNFTESLNQAVILSGASMREAEGALIQLSQGLASGTLQGDELRSVLEQLPMVADVIAQHLGVTRGELRKMGRDGQITAQIILDAFAAARGELADKFAATVPTIGQALQVLRNKFIQLWGEFSTGSGIARALAQAIVLVTNNLENIIPLILASGAAWATWRAASAVSATLGPLLALERALGATTLATALLGVTAKGTQRAFQTLTAAMASNPIGAVAVAILTVATLLYTFSDDIKVTTDGVVTLGDVFVATFQVIGELLSGWLAFSLEALATFRSVFETALEALGLKFDQVLSGMVDAVKWVTNAQIGLWVFAFNMVRDIWNDWPGALSAVMTVLVNLGIDAANEFINVWQAPFRFIAAGLEALGSDAAGLLRDVLAATRLELPRAIAAPAGQNFGRRTAANARDAFGTDYVGEFAGRVMDRARARAEARGAAGELNEAGAGAGVGAIAPSTARAAGRASEAAATDEAASALARFIAEKQNEIAVLQEEERVRSRMQEIFQLEEEMKRSLTSVERELVNARLDELDAVRDANTLHQMLEALARENELLGLNARERASRAAIIDYENQVKRAARPEERAAITDLVETNRLLGVRRDILDQLQEPTRNAIDQQAALNTLYSEGVIALRDYVANSRELQASLLEAFNPANFSEAMVVQWQQMDLAASQALTNIGTQVAKIFGPGGTLSQGIGDAVAGAIVFGNSFSKAIDDVARSILSQLISALVQVGVNMALQATLGRALQASTTATTVAAATAASTAWAPAAALASLATLGANAAPAAAALASTVALSSLLSSVSSALPGFMEGGYTGNAGRSTVAGVVHGQEFVANAMATRRHRSELEAMNRGSYNPGGVSVNIVNNAPGVEHVVSANREGEIEIIARRVLEREGPGVIARDMGSANSPTAKALRRTTTARPNRS